MTHLPLKQSVEQAIEQYFLHLEEATTQLYNLELYNLVLKEVEMGLFTVVMKQAQGNQSKAADWLGLARGTLRKKLQQYQIE